MQRELLTSLTAFKNKCGTGLFDSIRFNATNDGLGLTKGAALSRVALWSAINDILNLTHSLTPGQVATIVDASPIIVGPESVTRLSGASQLSDMDDEVRSQCFKWVPGIVCYSQLWSVARAANVDLPNDYLLNSRIEPAHYPQAALLAAVVFSGVHNTVCPNALHQALAIGSEYCRSVPRDLVDAAIDGNWGFLKASALSQEIASKIEGTLPPPDPALRQGTGAFLGPASLSDLYALCRGRPGKTHSTAELLAHTPFGLHTVFVAKRITGMNPDDDLMGAAIQGVNRAWETFCPIIIPQQSITQAKSKQGKDIYAEQAEFSLEGKKYQGSRLPTAVDIWVRKYVQIARGKNYGAIGIPREMQTMIAELKKRASALCADDEIPFEYALSLASEEMEVANLKRNKPAVDLPMRLNQARELLLGGGGTVRLDTDSEARGRTKHEMFAAEEPAPLRQSVLDAGANLIILPGKVPLQYPPSFVDRFDELYNFALAVKSKSAESLVHLAAGTRNISPDEVRELTDAIELYAEHPDLSRHYAKTIGTIQAFLSEAGYPTQSMFSAADAQRICDQAEERDGATIGAQIYAQLRVAAKAQLKGQSAQQAL
jgi:hypothetical protein